MKKSTVNMAVIAVIVVCSIASVVAHKKKCEGENFLDFAEFGQLNLRPLDALPTGTPRGESQWDTEQLPSFYPQIPGFTNTMPPDPGFRTVRTPKGKTCRCPVPHPYNFRDTERDTVCVKKTAQAFSSLCTAECHGYTKTDLYECLPRQALYRMG